MTEAREQALEALYEADLAAHPTTDHLSGKAGRLTRGVRDHLAEIDATLERVSHNWKLSRMPVVDRALLRLGTYELLYTDTPMAVVISEIVELAKTYSTERSGPFVNGVLAAVAEAAGR